MTRPGNNQQKEKRISRRLDFAVPADHRGKLKVKIETNILTLREN